MDLYTQMLLMMFARDWYSYTASTIRDGRNADVRDMMKERSRICGDEFKRLQRDFYELKE
ncbi:hypothetical protein B5G20_04985 [Collinsella sp. An7]|uniref:hypothetical protein n=1 Tax=Collinsella sp. An7 TaxID=1965651 RepID=UPI000B39C32E|nr:hypothetical protein [Collinsella sp. An7]OUN47323.1 hypothetical protein B5G20_04985 [Collinsella sp. An7]